MEAQEKLHYVTGKDASGVELWEVGGCVRDEIMGIPSKDIDYSVVADSFEEMKQFILDEGMTIVVENPEFATIRAIAPKSTFRGHLGGLDFVWAREDGPYSDGRRPDWTKPGTLMMDLARRDFRMNAIAKDEDGNLIDPFDGQGDIERRLIRAVGNAHTRIIQEDALRGMRALRFSIQKGFEIDVEVTAVLVSASFRDALRNIAIERVQKELELMFAVSTVKTLSIIRDFRLENTLFNGTGLRLMPTMKG